MRHFLFFFVAVLVWAQSDDPATDVFVRQLHHKAPAWAARIAAEQPDAVLQRILENSVTYLLPDGRKRSIHGNRVAHVDPDTREFALRDPQLWETDTGWAMRGSDLRARIVQRAGISRSDVGVFRKQGSEWVGFGLRLPLVSHVGEFVFSFGPPQNAWTLELGHFGFSITGGETAVPRGRRVYSFPYLTRGVTLSVDADGNLGAGDGHLLTRAVMGGADGILYPCSAWVLTDNEAGFACDDAALPAEAYPYRIDPTYTATDTGDGSVGCRCDGQYSGCGSGYVSYTSTSTAPARIKLESNPTKYDYWQYIFRISATQSGYYASAATLYLYPTSVACPTGSGINFKVNIETSFTWPVSYSDWVNWPGSSGGSWSTCGSFTADTWKGLSLSNTDLISNSGNTYYRLSMGGSPYSNQDNTVFFATVESSNDPYIDITWTPLAKPHVIVVSSGD